MLIVHLIELKNKAILIYTIFKKQKLIQIISSQINDIAIIFIIIAIVLNK